MILNEIPEIILINLAEEEALPKPKWVKAKVLFIAPRLEGAEESLREEYAVYCYTDDGYIHNAYLNNTQIVKTKKHEGVQNGAFWSSGGKSTRRRRKSHTVRNNNSRDNKPNNDKRESDSDR